MFQAFQLTILTPKTPHKQLILLRNNRFRIQTLFFNTKWTKNQIALQFPHITLRQIKYAFNHRFTSQKTQSKKRFLLGFAKKKQLIDWVIANRKNKRTPWLQIPSIFGWDCKVYAIKTIFKIKRFGRYFAFKKSKLIAKQVAIRLQWAYDYLY